MKKIVKSLFLGMMVFCSFALMAQPLSTKHSDYHQLSFAFKAPQLSFTNQVVNGVSFTNLLMDGSTPSTFIGRPNLPIISELVEIPLCTNVNVKVSNVQTKELQPMKNRIMPVQPAPSKSDRTPQDFVIDDQFYAQNADSDTPLAWVEDMGVARDRNVAILRISPIIYNPATGALRQVTSMDVTLTFEDADVAATQQLHQRYYSPDFSLGQNILGVMPCTKEIRTAAPVHYLIVAHSSFRGQLDQFVNWKKRQGFIVTVGYTDDPEVGSTSTTIAEYTKGFYTNATAELPAPTYLLLVGDVNQIPAFYSRCTAPASDHVTDLYYVTWTPNDQIPDCYIGRFSANNVAELTPQVDKTIYYESYGFSDDSYLNRACLIAGEDGGYAGDNAYRYADPAMDYIAKYYVNAFNGYTDVHYYKNNVSFAPAGVFVDGNCSTSSTAGTLRNLYNSGIGWVNYSAHGYDDSWGTPSFTATHANAMTNNGKPSIMIGNCCLSGRFNTTRYNACLGEALLRKGNNAGAVAYFGGTNSTYWPHDFCWSVGVRSSIQGNMDATYDAAHLGMYDRLFHTHNEDFSARHITAGSMTVAGNTAVQEYGSYALYYWEIYELFGDPSLMPWLSAADDPSVVAEPTIPIGTDNYTVTASPYAYVAITTLEDHDLICAAYANEQGVATLQLPGDVAVGEYELAVIAQNVKPYFQNVNVAVLDGPYVSVVDFSPVDASEIRPDNYVTFNVRLTNIGNQPATWGRVTFTSDKAVVVEPTYDFNNMANGDTLSITATFSSYLGEELTFGESVSFTVNVDWGAENGSSKRKVFDVVAPKLEVLDVAATPNLNAGENATIHFQIANVGNLPTDDLTFSLESPFGFLNAAPTNHHVGTIAAETTVDASFAVSVEEHAPATLIPFNLYAVANGRSILLGTYPVRCGQSSVDDFESGGLSAVNWSFNNNPWEVTSSGAHQGNYCARSKSNLGDRSTSELTITWSSEIDDSISFFYKVSSEENYDIFTFSIDGQETLSASGNVDWTRVAYAVRAGSHTYKFSYAKDYSVSNGEDCAWIDYATFPFMGTNCVFSFDSVCQNEPYQFAGGDVPTANAGKVHLVGIDGNTTNYIELNVIETPQVSIEVLYNNAGCKLLRAHGADRYEWNTGETTAVIRACPTGDNNLTVLGFRGQCSGEASYTLLGINDASAQNSVNLYPNPAHDLVTVAAEGIRSVQLLNLMGQVITTRRAESSRVSLDLQHLVPGVYFVRVETAEGVVVKKLIRR